MQRTLRVVPIVEGHGEVAAVRTLLQRIWIQSVQGDYVDVLSPIRHPKSKLLQEHGPERAVKLAAAKLGQKQQEDVPSLIIVLLDADDDCPAELGPTLAERARSTTQFSVEVFVAKSEYETWFAGAAASLSEFLDMGGSPTSDDPEEQGAGKAWSETATARRNTAKPSIRSASRRGWT